VNVKRVRRLYREEGRRLARRRPKQPKTAAVRATVPMIAAPNGRWAMDFVHDVLLTGEKMRVLTVIDVYSRECLALEAQRHFTGADVGAVLSRIASERGALAPIIKADQGTEFTSVALDHWAYGNAVTLAFSRPGTPGDNAHCEAFNATLRREVLSQHWFASLDEARYLLETWRTEYRNTRLHRSLANQPPALWATGSHTSRVVRGCGGSEPSGPTKGSLAPLAPLTYHPIPVPGRRSRH